MSNYSDFFGIGRKKRRRKPLKGTVSGQVICDFYEKSKKGVTFGYKMQLQLEVGDSLVPGPGSYRMTKNRFDKRNTSKKYKFATSPRFKAPELKKPGPTSYETQGTITRKNFSIREQINKLRKIIPQPRICSNLLPSISPGPRYNLEHNRPKVHGGVMIRKYYSKKAITQRDYKEPGSGAYKVENCFTERNRGPVLKPDT